MLVESGTPCRCIRSREVKNKKFDPEDVKLVVRRYCDYEYFISYESKDESTIYGFCRLRLNSSNENVIFPELIDAALIRELHVYGLMVPHNQEKDKKAAQHMGFGRKLLKAAEEIARTNGYNKIAVISGIGVRKYYEKNGYQIEGTYMTKSF
jgi:elongator complex protein 3